MPIPAAFDLSGRVAVVTGAGSPDGIGFAAAGAAGDLTDPGAASAVVSAALGRWGRLDIVVNNAGMISAADPVFESGTVDAMDLATWQAALARNLTTAFLVTKAALPAMISRGWGRIIMLASPGASYITGQYLVVDGGNSIAEQRATP